MAIQQLPIDGAALAGKLEPYVVNLGGDFEFPTPGSDKVAVVIFSLGDQQIGYRISILGEIYAIGLEFEPATSGAVRCQHRLCLVPEGVFRELMASLATNANQAASLDHLRLGHEYSILLTPGAAMN